MLAPTLLVLVPLTYAEASIAAARGWLADEVVEAPPAGQTRGMVYCNGAGTPLAMDLTAPVRQSDRPPPAIVYVHGGAGFLGSRGFASDVEGNYFRQIRDDLSNDGFVVASIDYGFIPLHSLADTVEDARCAVRFLRVHAQTLEVDPNRVGIYGDSEGGYVAAMLGTTRDAHPDSRLQAVVDLWGFTDLADFSGSPGWVASIGAASRSGKDAAAANSPLNLVQSTDPPFLIVHGADDWFIAPHRLGKTGAATRAGGGATEPGHRAERRAWHRGEHARQNRSSDSRIADSNHLRVLFSARWVRKLTRELYEPRVGAVPSRVNMGAALVASPRAAVARGAGRAYRAALGRAPRPVQHRLGTGRDRCVRGLLRMGRRRQ